MLHCCQRVLAELLDALRVDVWVGHTFIAFLLLKSVICDRKHDLILNCVLLRLYTCSAVCFVTL
jgi:hypothetical protein